MCNECQLYIDFYDIHNLLVNNYTKQKSASNLDALFKEFIFA